MRASRAVDSTAQIAIRNLLDGSDGLSGREAGLKPIKAVRHAGRQLQRAASRGRGAVKRLWTALAFVSLLAAPVIAQKTPAPDLLKRALAVHPSRQLYAYDFEEVVTVTVPKKAAQISTTRGHVDPSREKGDRVTIAFAETAIGGKPVNIKQMDKTYEEAADGDIFCDSLSKEDVSGVVDKGTTVDGHHFTFIPKAEDKLDGEEKNLMKKMLADVVLDEASGTILGFNAKLLKQHNVMLVMDILTMTMKIACQPLPSGRTYAARADTTSVLSSLGVSVDTTVVNTISNVTPVG